MDGIGFIRSWMYTAVAVGVVAGDAAVVAAVIAAVVIVNVERNETVAVAAVQVYEDDAGCLADPCSSIGVIRA